MKHEMNDQELQPDPLVGAALRWAEGEVPLDDVAERQSLSGPADRPCSASALTDAESWITLRRGEGLEGGDPAVTPGPLFARLASSRAVTACRAHESVRTGCRGPTFILRRGKYA